MLKKTWKDCPSRYLARFQYWLSNTFFDLLYIGFLKHQIVEKMIRVKVGFWVDLQTLWSSETAKREREKWKCSESWQQEWSVRFFVDEKTSQNSGKKQVLRLLHYSFDHVVQAGLWMLQINLRQVVILVDRKETFLSVKKISLEKSFGLMFSELFDECWKILIGNAM